LRLMIGRADVWSKASDNGTVWSDAEMQYMKDEVARGKRWSMAGRRL
jgi:hypothetical protein